MFLSAKTIERLKQLVKPKSIYQDLAEDGYLRDYINRFFSERIKKDAKFRDEMYSIMLKHSNKQIPEIDVFYLEKLGETLGFFLEYVKEWKIQKH